MVSQRDKFSYRAIKCVFLGYPPGKKAYKLLDLSTQNVLYSRDVVFYESVFPFKDPLYNTPDGHVPLFQHDEYPPPDIFVSPPPTPATAPSTSSTTHIPPPPTTSRPHRIRTVPTKFNDFTNLPPSFTASPQVNNVSHSPPFISYELKSPSYHSHICNMSPLTEPHSYSQAIQDPNWCVAMASELNALEQNDTRTLQVLPPGKIVVGCKWIFRIKFLDDGSLDNSKQD